MTYADIYEVNLNIEKQKTEVLPANYSFFLEDSIFKLFPSATVYLDDDSAFSQEYLLTMEGLSYEINLGMKDDFITNSFVIVNDSMEDPIAQGTLGGVVAVNLIHEMYSNQSKLSTIYDDRISNIVSKLADKQTFNKKHINDTGNASKWIQPLVSDSDFIVNYLLPFAYSNNSSNTPFYCFIDSNNEFNFRNHFNMMESSPVADLTLSGGHGDSVNRDAILDIKRVRKGSNYTYKLRHRKLYTFSETDYSMSFKDDYIYSYPKQNNLLPLKADLDNVTDYMMLYDHETTKGDEENNLGYTINSARDGMGLEKFIITTPLNVHLRAGKTVQVNVPDISDQKQDSFSIYFTGKYLVESSRHVWDGGSTSGTSVCVISRKSVTAPDVIYNLKGVMVNG